MEVANSVIGVLHVFAAVLAAGGAFFQLFALHPALAQLPADSRRPIREAIAARWRMVVFISIAVLLVTGFANFLIFKVPEHSKHPHKGIYHGLLGLKILAALLSFHAATVLALPGSRGEKYRDQAGFWLKFLATCLTIVIVIAVVLNRFPRA
jgi:uncharacterized membrane protein